MAFFNGKEILLAGLKGDSCFIRYSAHADGTDFTEERGEGQDYIGIATGQTAPTDKSEYVWCMFSDDVLTKANEAAEKAEESVKEVESIKYMFANALKGYVQGNPIALTDVSPFQHEIACKVVKKNLYDITDVDAFAKSFYTNNTFSVNKDSTYAEQYRSLKVYLEAGTYTFSSSVKLTIAREIKDGAFGNITANTPYTFTVNTSGYCGLSFKKADGTNWDDTVNHLLQIEKGSTATSYTPYLESVEGLEVKAYGKNLLSDAVYDLNNWVRDEGISINATNSKVYYLDEIPNGTYTISAKANETGVYLYFFYSKDGGATWEAYNGKSGVHYILASANAYAITFEKTDNTRFLLWKHDVNWFNRIDYIQIEAGATATAYEPYKAPITYTTDAEGGLVIPSVAPCLTLVADVGAVLDVEYNRDINTLNTVLDLNTVESKINAAKAENSAKIASTNQVVNSHESRISTIESWIDSKHIYETLENEYDWYDVEGERVQQSRIILPKNVSKYAKAMRICGHISSYNSTMYYNNMVCNYPYQIMNDNGEVLITIPTNLTSNLADFGIQENYIFFEDGKVYYRQGAKIESYDYSVSNMQEGEYVIDSVYDAAEIIGLAKPIITDITDMISVDPIIDIEGCAYLTIVPRVTEDEVRWNAEMGEGESKHYDFNMPKVEIVVEVV